MALRSGIFQHEWTTIVIFSQTSRLYGKTFRAFTGSAPGRLTETQGRGGQISIKSATTKTDYPGNKREETFPADAFQSSLGSVRNKPEKRPV
jgi:hypothetical protein